MDDSGDTPAASVPAAAGTMHQDPYEAAKQIRKLVRQARDSLEYSEAPATTANLSHAQDVVYWLVEAQNRVTRVEAAIRGRKPDRRDIALAELKSVLAHADTRAKRVRDGLASPPKPEGIKKALREIHVLAQSLPTTAHNPLTPADNVLRAMTVVLINAGYAKPAK